VFVPNKMWNGEWLMGRFIIWNGDIGMLCNSVWKEWK